MKRIYLLACGAVLSGCIHSAPSEVKKDLPASTPAPAPVQAPAPVVKQEKPELTMALVEQSVIKGKTTKDELLAKLGSPNSVVKHPYHVPKITTPGFNIKVPPEMMAAETWNYWKPTKISADNVVLMVLMVKVYLDEAGVALDYEMAEKDVSKQPGL
jgi:hypothetical protein